MTSFLMNFIHRLLTHPLVRHTDIDAPQTTELRRQVILGKRFLYQLYEDWYRGLAKEVPSGRKPVLEIGSGAGFLNRLIPNLISSDILQCTNMTLVLDGGRLPFANESLRAILMNNVLHHAKYPHAFFSEAARCVEAGGRLAMNEPWVTPWSRLIYTHLHHEPFIPDSADWKVSRSGPLSGANGALPWIIFSRDYETFSNEFPCWELQDITLHTAIRYVLSGGVSKRSMMPGWMFGIMSQIDHLLSPHAAMFARIVLRRV